METQFHYDLEQKQLNFKVRQRMSSVPGVQLKGKGLFNTVTGKASYDGTLTAGTTLGRELKGAGSTPLRLAAGVHVASSDVKVSPDPQLHVYAKKAISVFDGPRTVASVKAVGNLDTDGRVTTRAAVLKLSHKWLRFTQRQDLKLTAGLDVDWPVGAQEPKATPFASIKENNWALNYRKQRWFVTYDL